MLAVKDAILFIYCTRGKNAKHFHVKRRKNGKEATQVHTMRLCVFTRRRSQNKFLQKPKQCKWCDYSTIQSSSLTKHILTHSGVKPYHCKECGSSFSQAKHLKTHLRIHTGEEPYKCSQCSYYSAQSSDFKKHMTRYSTNDIFCPTIWWGPIFSQLSVYHYSSLPCPCVHDLTFMTLVVDNFSWQKLLLLYWLHQHRHHHRLRHQHHHHHHHKYMSWKNFTF